MPALLAALSVLLLWSALGAIAVGLRLIHRALEGVRRQLEPIAVMVPLIDRQTSPLAARGVARQLTESIRAASALGVGAAQNHDDVLVARRQILP